ncbi:transposase [Streptomyces sp. NPDC056660]|uniref:transposase n=1 Tax=Streptomyces sp. NPDC056660 TaxID=3345897 RepID=UPI0036BB4A0D
MTRSRGVYVVMALPVDGNRGILGIWVGDGGEGVKYWLHVFTELKNRGLDDVLMLLCVAYRNFAGADKDPLSTYVFGTKPFSAPEGRTITSVELPDYGDLHVFTLATE